MKKAIVAALVVLAVILVPKLSISNDNSDTIVLEKNNTLVLNSEVNGQSVSDIISKAKTLDSDLAFKSRRMYHAADNKPLYLFVDSPGGNIQSGLELIEALHGIGRPIHTVTLFGASMAWQIVQNLGDRLVLRNGVLMSHRAAGGFEGSFGGVRPSQVDSRYQLWLDRVKELDEQTVKRTNGRQTYESYTNSYSSEMWLTGTKAVAGGYADRIVTVKCGSTLTGTTAHYAMFLGMRISYELDACPLNTQPLNARISDLNGKTLTTELEAEVLAKFVDRFENKQKQIVPMY